VVHRRPQSTRSERRRRWLIPVGVLATMLPLAQSASAGVPTGGSATAQPALVVLIFDGVGIELVDRTTPLDVGPTAGEQTVPGILDVSDDDSNSSLVATSTSVSVARTAAGVEATATVDGLQLTLSGTMVAAATTITTSANCPAGASAVGAQAQVNALTLGDAAPVDLSGGQTARGATTITDEAGQAIGVDLEASLFVDSASSSGESVLRLTVIIDNQSATAQLAIARCTRPQGGSGTEAPGPEGPGDALANSGTETAVVAALLGIVLLAGGGSVLLWAHGQRSRRTDPQ